MRHLSSLGLIRVLPRCSSGACRLAFLLVALGVGHVAHAEPKWLTPLMGKWVLSTKSDFCRDPEDKTPVWFVFT
jgi:hypothetical protein